MGVEEIFSVIAEQTRRDILQALAVEHKAVGQLVDELGVSQPTVSKHLRVLRVAGVVTMEAQGQKRFYSINVQPLSLVSQWLDGLGAGVPATTPENTIPSGNDSALNLAEVESVTVESGVVLHGHEAESTDHEGSVQHQITRSVGRAANKAADLLANLPTFRRRKD